MGLRYRKSINLGGGFRVNLSTKGIGYSFSNEDAADKLDRILASRREV